MKISRLQNTLFFMSEKHNCPIGYIVLQFRKRKIVTRLSDIRRTWRAARRLESIVPVTGTGYDQLVDIAKYRAYCNRHDLERATDTVIASIKPSASPVSLAYAIDLVLNGIGISAGNKRLKPITCIEKRIKTYKHMIDMLRDQFEK